MAERALTATEIDALLSIFRGGRSTRPQRADVENFDVNQPCRVPRSAFSALRIRHQQAARQLGLELKAILSREMSVTLLGFEQVVFDPWRRSLPDPCCAFSIRMEPMHDPAVLVVDHGFAFRVLDRLLGGLGDAKVGVRDLTPTEVAVLDEIIRPLLAVHEAVWSPYIELRSKAPNPIFVPDFIRDINDKEVVLAANYRVDGLGESATIRFAMPTSGLEPHLQHEPRQDPVEQDRDRVRRLLEGQMREASVSCAVRVGSAELALADLVGLEPGDVLVLDRQTDGEVELLIEGSAKVSGYLKRVGRRLVFECARSPYADAAEPPEPSLEGESDE